MRPSTLFAIVTRARARLTIYIRTYMHMYIRTRAHVVYSFSLVFNDRYTRGHVVIVRSIRHLSIRIFQLDITSRITLQEARVLLVSLIPAHPADASSRQTITLFTSTSLFTVASRRGRYSRSIHSTETRTRTFDTMIRSFSMESICPFPGDGGMLSWARFALR